MGISRVSDVWDHLTVDPGFGVQRRSRVCVLFFQTSHQVTPQLVVWIGWSGARTPGSYPPKHQTAKKEAEQM